MLNRNLRSQEMDMASAAGLQFPS